MQHHLELINIIKDYPGVRALAGVSMAVRTGEIVSICGENGAGKSTLMKVLSGVIPFGHFEGEIKINGEVARFHSLKESEAHGISIIHQELTIILELSLAENIYLGHEQSRFGFLHKKKMWEESKRLLAMVGLSHSPSIRASELSIGQIQLLEIAKALSQNPKFLILDEPTSALADSEVDRLLNVLRDLKAAGVACLLISHKLEEVFSVAERILVLRDGSSVAELTTSTTNQQEVIKYMVGRELKNIYPERIKTVRSQTPTLEVQGFTNAWVQNVSFSLYPGEVLGIAGLMGSGRSELLLSLFGAGPRKMQGEISLLNKKYKPTSPAKSAKAGIVLVTEDRKTHGLILEHAVLDNSALTPLSLGFLSCLGMIFKRKRFSSVKNMLDQLKLKTPSLVTFVQNLSGGNQQKVVLSKWLLSKPKVLFLDEPTRGIDVGARSEFYTLIRGLAREGMAVLVVSSELPEVMGLSDRMLVMNNGKVVFETDDLEIKPETLMSYATGATTL